jgi:hypothetical protein
VLFSEPNAANATEKARKLEGFALFRQSCEHRSADTLGLLFYLVFSSPEAAGSSYFWRVCGVFSC